MTGKGHMIAGTSLIVINDALLNLLSKQISKLSFVPDTFSLFEHYRNIISRIWIPEAASGTWVAKSITVITVALYLVIFWIGCLLPDIDHPNSIMGQRFHIPIPHRTWTHTIWIVAILAIPAIWIPAFFWLTYAYFLHLCVDAFSRGGVCFFYPISKYLDYPSGAHVKKKHIFKLYRPGGRSETVVCCILIVFASISILSFIRYYISSL